MTENPAEPMRRAVKLMRERAEAATPGPWERPLDTCYKNAVIAALPDGEEGSYRTGVIPAEFASHSGPTGRYAGQRERVGVVSAAIWSIGGFIRKRSGRDLEHIAAMHPLVALAVADWLEGVTNDHTWDSDLGECSSCGSAPCGPHPLIEYCRECCDDWPCAWAAPALNVARAYLGEVPA